MFILLSLLPSSVHPNVVKQSFVPSALLSMCSNHFHLHRRTSLISAISTTLLFAILCLCCYLYVIRTIHLRPCAESGSGFSFSSSFLVIIVHRPLPACTASSRPSRSMHFGEESEKNGRENLFFLILRHAYFRESCKKERLTTLKSRTQSSAQSETKCLTCPSFG